MSSVTGACTALTVYAPWSIVPTFYRLVLSWISLVFMALVVWCIICWLEGFSDKMFTPAFDTISQLDGYKRLAYALVAAISLGLRQCFLFNQSIASVYCHNFRSLDAWPEGSFTCNCPRDYMRHGLSCIGSLRIGRESRLLCHDERIPLLCGG